MQWRGGGGHGASMTSPCEMNFFHSDREILYLMFVKRASLRNIHAKNVLVVEEWDMEISNSNLPLPF